MDYSYSVVRNAVITLLVLQMNIINSSHCLSHCFFSFDGQPLFCLFRVDYFGIVKLWFKVELHFNVVRLFFLIPLFLKLF